MKGKVLQLYISTTDPQKKRQIKQAIEVDTNGVIGDKFYAKDSARAILLTSKESYEIASKEGIDMQEGALGENIYIDINPYNLALASKIKIGEVTFEVMQHCTLCKGLASIDTKLPKLLKNDRGIFIKALHKGKIKVGDSVQLQE